ncbi:MAG TPA: cytidylate kinase-like family protein [Bryobacteraceae bacterium]|nr:cytidylate kinase-like family protein [Bryobacteraceae bacterium]HXR17683.1 cytidylate kinase-like family protein [Terriglobales bacterium]HZW91977.1 cytidylate kinase-like family protein [Candidatus Eremiobacteraceae bacterium]
MIHSVHTCVAVLSSTPGREVIMFKVVTVAREYGSAGSCIAKRVAEELGWNLLDQELIWDVARAAQVDAETVAVYDEHVDSWWYRFNRDGLWAASLTAGVTLEDAQFFDAETTAAFAERVISEAAVTGNCVIVGRGAECVLQGRGDVLNVFIYDSWEERVSRVRNRVNSSQDVEELIRLTDHERARYIRTNYGFDWKDPHLYHMMISSQIGIETAGWMIVNAVKR